MKLSDEEFVVEEVVSESQAIRFTPDSEIIVGGRSPLYDAGYTSRLMLKVRPSAGRKPETLTLYFDGVSAVRAGDKIKARYTTENIPSAIELVIFDDSGKIARTDRSVRYKQLAKTQIY